MKISASLLGLALLVFLCSACVEDFDINDSQEVSKNFIENIAIPSDFHFEMTYSQQLEISIKDSSNKALPGIPIFYYDKPWYDGGILLGAGISDAEGMIYDKLQLPYGGQALFAYTPTDRIVRAQRIVLPGAGNPLQYAWGENPSASDSLAFRFTDPFTQNLPEGKECTEHALSNEDFENFETDLYISREESNSGKFSITYDESDIEGWATTAEDKQIELWISGHKGVGSHSGMAHVELNAQSEAQLYQDLSTLPGATIHWSIWHRGRRGQDTAAVLIGPAGGSLTQVEVMNSGKSNWQNYTGTYTVPLGQTRTRLGFEAIGAAGGNILEGNFLDLFEVEVCISSQLEHTKDTDGDGLGDHWDLYPQDRQATFSNFFPGASTFATYAFEDSWPHKGDYDFNDLILNYNYEWIKNTDNLITQARLSFVVQTVGSANQLGFGLSFEDLEDVDINSIVGTQTTGISTRANGTENGTDKPTFILFDDVHNLFGLSPNVLINSGDSNAVEKAGYPFEIVVNFSHPIEEVGTLNPFIFTGGIRSRETHLKGFQPTSQANYSFLGTEDDASQGGHTYQTSSGLPFGLNFPETLSPSMEGHVIIDPYPKFTIWVTSNGRSEVDWYKRTQSKLLFLNPRSR